MQKTKIMASGFITSWRIDEETRETVRGFFGRGCSKITADGDYSHEIKRHFLLGRKARTNLDSVLKSRDIALPIKVHLVKALVFQIVMYGCESWTIKKAEQWRTDAFELWCWRRLFFKKFILIGGKLQYCSAFCHTLSWVSHRCTWLPHPECPSLRVLPVHQPWVPCLMHITCTGNLFHMW